MDIREEFLQDKRKEEYQYQHFQFTSSIFKNELKEMEMSIIEDAVEKMKNSLTGKYSTKTEVIQSASNNLVEEFAHKADEWVSSIEDKLEGAFIGIPSHVLLPDDKPQVEQYSKEYVEQIQAEMKDLEKKLLQAKFMKAKLEKGLRASHACLEAISGMQDEQLGEEWKEFVESTNKVLSDLRMINEGSSYVADELVDDSSPHDEWPSFAQINLRMLKELL